MSARAFTPGSNVTALRKPARKNAPVEQSNPSRQRADVGRYIAQMTLELERLANTADLELLAYFLAMARAEAEAIGGQADAAPHADTQAPYRAE